MEEREKRGKKSCAISINQEKNRSAAAAAMVH